MYRGKAPRRGRKPLIGSAKRIPPVKGAAPVTMPPRGGNRGIGAVASRATRRMPMPAKGAVSVKTPGMSGNRGFGAPAARGKMVQNRGRVNRQAARRRMTAGNRFLKGVKFY